uniref:Translation initiation factor IF-2, chloroplastic n=1 Tax=Lophocladia kuetzingii TaxID=675577 RepID=A0A1Z1MNH1_9FLOR|nr:translation initiation factor 2 [Lophocladia kuetzingii]ARW67643.1 translation initiation factor 2 [Lophocladia kuetzingii]
MIYLFLLSQNSCYRFFFQSIFNYSIDIIYSDTPLILVSPKLINYLDVKSINTSISPVINNTSNNKFTLSSKFEKKYKVHNDQEVVDARKSKLKVSKKKRKNISNIDHEDIFHDNVNALLSENSLDMSIIKSRKLNRIKKRDKAQIEISCSSVVDKNKNYKKEVYVAHPLSIQELCFKLNIPDAEIIRYLFLTKSISATLNQVLDINIIKEIVTYYGFTLVTKHNDSISDKIFSIESNESSINIQRAPIITILGHVDHGKTSLLDAILKTDLVQKELGGITQSISGYKIQWNYNSNNYELIFIDTPGHESFKALRLRGAKVTDIALLVIAADDNLKPQTIEAIEYIKEMSLNCIVVITKIDRISTNIDLIKQEISGYGLVPQDWGGDIMIIEVSALTGYNIDKLLSYICLLCDTNHFVTNPSQMANGTILEAYLDKKQGPVANLVIQNGTLHLGNIIISSNSYGKIKNITDISGKKIQSAIASSIVQILGFSEVPRAGLSFKVVLNEKEAKQYCAAYLKNNNVNPTKKILNTRISAENMQIKQLQLIIKTNTQGSLEAIIDLLSSIPQNKVQINIIAANLGNISNKDIELSLAFNAMIIGFNINASMQINNLIKKYDITFQNFGIIYDLYDYIESSMLNLITPEYDKVFIGSAVVQAIFNMNKGYVAGCLVNEGKLKKMCYIYVYRKEIIVHEGYLNSLKHLKSDVDEVYADDECGVMCDYNLWQLSDIIKAYDLVLRDKSL